MSDTVKLPLELSIDEVDILGRSLEYGLATLQRAIDQAEGKQRQMRLQGIVTASSAEIAQLPNWHEQRKLGIILSRRLSSLRIQLERSKSNGSGEGNEKIEP